MGISDEASVTQSVSFSPETTSEVVRKACVAAGLDGSGAELMRLGDNAVYRLVAEPVIVRIGRSVEDLAGVEKQVRVARWLEEVGFPAVRVVPGIEQPLVVDGRVVVFWESLGEETVYASVPELGELLRRLHGLEQPESLELPELEPLRKTARRVEAAALLSADERGFLLERRRVLLDRYAALKFALPRGPIHGDANIGNIIRDQDGQARLIDLDGFAVGSREWDLTLTATYYERFGWHSRDEYRSFCEVYGFDVMAWPGYPVLRDMRELIMVAWLSQNMDEGEEIATEVHKRVADLRAGDGPRGWKPF